MGRSVRPVQETPAAAVVRVFGGVRAAARALGKDPATIHRWVKSGLVSADTIGRALDCAEAHGLPLTAEQLIFRDRRRGRHERE